MRKIFLALLISLFSVTLMAQEYMVDVSKLADGEYMGSQASGVYVFTFTATVKVKNGEIVSIKGGKYPNNLVKKEATKIYKKMIKENKVDIDGVTRATFKALVYNALMSSPK